MNMVRNANGMDCYCADMADLYACSVDVAGAERSHRPPGSKRYRYWMANPTTSTGFGRQFRFVMWYP